MPLYPAAMPMGSTVDVFATEDPNITESAEQELQLYEKKDNVLHGHRNKKYPAKPPLYSLLKKHVILKLLY